MCCSTRTTVAAAARLRAARAPRWRRRRGRHLEGAGPPQRDEAARRDRDERRQRRRGCCASSRELGFRPRFRYQKFRTELALAAPDRGHRRDADRRVRRARGRSRRPSPTPRRAWAASPDDYVRASYRSLFLEHRERAGAGGDPAAPTWSSIPRERLATSRAGAHRRQRHPPAAADLRRAPSRPSRSPARRSSSGFCASSRRPACRDVVLNLHHRPETIAAVVGEGRDLRACRCATRGSSRSSGSAGGPRRALPLLDSGTVSAHQRRHVADR